MALQSSGTIKMSEINTELGRSSNATISLDSAESGTYATINTASASYPNDARPAAISEWYSYDHNASSGPAGYNGLLSNTSAPDPGEMCVADTVLDVYKNGTSSTPVIGNYLFSDAQLTTNLSPKNGFNQWYKYEDMDGGNLPYIVFLLQGGGGECIIESVQPCF